MIETLDVIREAPSILNPLMLSAGGILVGSVSYTERQAAIRRANGQCEDKSGDRHLGDLEFSHNNHNKKDPKYNTIESGQILCQLHHLDAHLENEGTNGLTKNHNNFAIRSLASRIAGFFIAHKDE